MIERLVCVVVGGVVGLSLGALLTIDDDNSWHKPISKGWLIYFIVSIILSVIAIVEL